MNLKSCDSCGVVFDLNKLTFPDIFDSNYEVITTRAVYVDEQYKSFVYCKVCGAKILEE